MAHVSEPKLCLLPKRLTAAKPHSGARFRLEFLFLRNFFTSIFANAPFAKLLKEISALRFGFRFTYNKSIYNKKIVTENLLNKLKFLLLSKLKQIQKLQEPTKRKKFQYPT